MPLLVQGLLHVTVAGSDVCTIAGLSAPLQPAHSTMHAPYSQPETCALLLHRLRLARLPCLNMGRGNKPNWQPIELCWIAKGQRRMKLDERQQGNMVRVAAQDPKDRQRWIEHCANDVAKLHLDPSLAAFGLSVSTKMSSVSDPVIHVPSDD